MARATIDVSLVNKTMYNLDKIALAVQPKMKQDLRGIDPARASAINHLAFDLRVCHNIADQEASNPLSDHRDCRRRLRLGTC